MTDPSAVIWEDLRFLLKQREDIDKLQNSLWQSFFPEEKDREEAVYSQFGLFGYKSLTRQLETAKEAVYLAQLVADSETPEDRAKIIKKVRESHHEGYVESMCWGRILYELREEVETILRKLEQNPESESVPTASTICLLSLII